MIDFGDGFEVYIAGYLPGLLVIHLTSADLNGRKDLMSGVEV